MATISSPAPSLDRFTPSRAPRSFRIEDRVELTAPRAAEIEASLGPRTAGQLLVKLPREVSAEEFAQDYGARLSHRFEIPEKMQDTFDGQLVTLDLPPTLAESAAMAAMELDPRALLTGTNDTLELQNEKLPNDLHPEQWGLKNNGHLGGQPGCDIHAAEAWGITTGDRNGPIVAVLDSGIDVNHPDLKNNLWRNPLELENRKDDDLNGFVDDVHGVNTVRGDGSLHDSVGHGTHVAGIIAAEGNNGQGVTGVNWQGQLMGVKIAEKDRISLIGVVYGILYAADKGARIANHSWGGPIHNPVLENVMESAPMLHVCSAGNGQRDTDLQPSFPASYEMDNLISVAASTTDDEHLFLSNWGARTVDIHAPGAMIYSTLPNGEYGEESGTSMAAPHASGVAALIASAYPEASAAQIKDRILYGSDPLPALHGKSVTGGRLNAFRSLEDDRVAPARVSDLRLDAVSADGFELSWTGTGDDGQDGRPARYELVADFGDHQQNLIVAFPQDPGAAERHVHRTLPVEVERPVTLRLTPIDNVGNRAEAAVVETVLPAATVAFSDDMETDTGWRAEGPWARVAVPGRGQVWTDSPGGNYEDGRQTTLVSPAFDLTGLRSASLTLDAQIKLEQWDFLFLEVSTDGQDWRHLGVVRGGGERDWKSHRFDLSQFDGQPGVRLRFELRTNDRDSDDGVYLDNVRVIGAHSGPTDR